MNVLGHAADWHGDGAAGIQLGAVDLRRAYLIRAELPGAYLHGARLDGARLDGARVSDSTRFPEGAEPVEITRAG